MKLSEKQRVMLQRALDGEDIHYPDRIDRYGTFRPANHWLVPKGKLVPNGSQEYAACRALRRHGLMRPWFGGQGGYEITPAGRRAMGQELVEVHFEADDVPT